MRLIKFIVIILIVGAVLAFFVWYWPSLDKRQETRDKKQEEEIETTYTKSFEVVEGSTFGKLMETASVTPSISQAMFNAAQDVYDLTNVRLGRTIDLVYDKETDELEQLVYQIDSEEKLYVTSQATTTGTTTQQIWVVERILIPYEIKTKTVEGVIESSMWESGLEQGIDERAIIVFADVLQWSVDFAWQVKKGDSYKFIYEERYLDGEYIMPGKIIAGKFINEGKDLYTFYYQDPEDNEGYYDQDGNSVQKVFLKAPLAFKYISSGFTTGMRYLEAFGFSTTHRAIDYAASYGTPVRSVGDGTVVFAGWGGAYGNKISVRHNSTYTTNYCHLSKIAVKYGQKVTQGQTIGNVGSTGLSTGPHLHYEMVKNGTKINPLTEEFPSTEGIKEENKELYFEAIKEWEDQLSS